ncbi:hypothetical protein [Marinomonas ostreistagni]|uniref:hypothetical protein n=1 Tax=Marinomonas ostreistagni TaxID=359209 RepID=UPI00194E588A|nr:hypothetical protein [Marinomonas ostreistagni]MBM6551820.1 hypothetical protein [Marinomonas ostreistagni]
MNRERFNQTLWHAIICAICFAVIVFVYDDLPRVDIFGEILRFSMVLTLIFLNIIMLVGFTSLQYDKTKAFYALVVPIYPLYLACQDYMWRWEWLEYALMLIPYAICAYALWFALNYRVVARSVESVALILALFSLPFLYSPIMYFF